jgi:hypothetical protein
MKNKWDIIGKDIDKEIDLDYEEWFGWWYDGEDYFDYGYGEDYVYDYSNSIYNDYVYHRFGKSHFGKVEMGSYIDILSIYPKEIIRDIKISQILGLDISYKPTFADLLKNKNCDEGRDI